MKEGNTHPVICGQPLCSGAFDKALVVGILDLQAEQVSFH